MQTLSPHPFVVEYAKKECLPGIVTRVKESGEPVDVFQMATCPDMTETWKGLLEAESESIVTGCKFVILGDRLLMLLKSGMSLIEASDLALVQVAVSSGLLPRWTNTGLLNAASGAIVQVREFALLSPVGVFRSNPDLFSSGVFLADDYHPEDEKTIFMLPPDARHLLLLFGGKLVPFNRETVEPLASKEERIGKVFGVVDIEGEAHPSSPYPWGGDA